MSFRGRCTTSWPAFGCSVSRLIPGYFWGQIIGSFPRCTPQRLCLACRRGGLCGSAIYALPGLSPSAFIFCRFGPHLPRCGTWIPLGLWPATYWGRDRGYQGRFIRRSWNFIAFFSGSLPLQNWPWRIWTRAFPSRHSAFLS